MASFPHTPASHRKEKEPTKGDQFNETYNHILVCLSDHRLVVTGGAGTGNGDFTSGQVYIIDKTLPTVTSVSATNANGTYIVGSVIAVTVTFSEVVRVTGTPQLKSDLQDRRFFRRVDPDGGCSGSNDDRLRVCCSGDDLQVLLLVVGLEARGAG